MVGPPGLEPGTYGFTIRQADVYVFPRSVDYLTALHEAKARDALKPVIKNAQPQ